MKHPSGSLVQRSPPSSTPAHATPGAEVLRQTASSPGGLAQQEAAARRQRYGPNPITIARPVPARLVLARQFRSAMVALLAAAAMIAVLSGDLVDGVAIIAVLIINVLIGFTLELRAHRAMESLRSLEVAHARVIRDGALRDVDARELVPGDVIEIDAGSAIPADARLLDAVELRTMESVLTGESVPVDKNPNARLPTEAPLSDRTTMVYQATTAVAGRGRAVVVATGMATEVGRIGALVGGIAVHRTPLELRLDTLGRRFAVIAVAVALLVSIIALRQGVPLGELIQTALALAVAAVPEGLPIVGTIAMAVGVRRMARRKALIRRLPVVETLGSATVICTDKTGTLTAGEMTVTVLRIDDREIAVSGVGYAPAGEFRRDDQPVDVLGDSRLRAALRICGLTARGDVAPAGKSWTAVGDPTEAALAVLARKAGLTHSSLLVQYPEVGEVAFTSRRMLMATFHRTPSGIIALAKGAPQRILQLCTRKLTATGPEELDPAGRSELLQLNRELAGRGLRVLALAQKDVGEATQGELQGLTWVAFVGIADPPASGVKDTVADFHRAGIRVVMLTGDQQHTAERVALDLGLLTPGAVVVDGREVDRLRDDGLREAVAGAAGFSRVSPEAKLRIVQAYQAGGEIVAMLGDGINDAAALRQADIGVAMGQRGTDLAKDAADVILEDDRFPTIASAIEQGRVVFDNIRKFVFYLFSCNLAEIMVLLGAGVAGLPSPLLPLQILWLNLLTDTVPALALAGEPAERDIMRQPPRDPRQAIFSAAVARATLGYASLISLASLLALAWGLARHPGNWVYAGTLTFMTLGFAQIFHLGNARSERAVLRPARVVANPYALAAVLLTAGLQILAVESPWLARVLRTQALASADWVVVVGLSLVPAGVGQMLKLVAAFRRRSLVVA